MVYVHYLMILLSSYEVKKSCLLILFYFMMFINSIACLCSIVHLCRTISDNQLVIVKEIPLDDLTTEDRIASKNEINVLKMLHHPNIIGYYDSFTAEKSLMIVMEYAPGTLTGLQ